MTREELRADLLDDHGYCVNCGEDAEDCECAFDEFIDAILAAGYVRPRTITAAKELDTLPMGSVVLDAQGWVAVILSYSRWATLPTRCKGRG